MPGRTDSAAYLDGAIDRYAPEVAATARAALKTLRARFPGARLMVYERRRQLPIGFAPAGRGGAVFSVVRYPRWVRFFFLESVALDDPEGRLEGGGHQVRSIRLDDHAAVLDDPYIMDLMTQAVEVEYDHTLSHTDCVPATERVTITLPADLLEEVDQLERNRSRFIAEAVRHEVTRRRRAALLESVRSPHPEATQLVDVGLADWTSELPDDEGLLDPASGTAVRWVEGEGWIKESV